MPLNKSLPSYKKPPVNEVVCGAVFQTPEKLRIPHIGVLWQKFSKDYPNLQHAQPIISLTGSIYEDGMTGMPLPRIWFINEQDNQLIQFQFDRFYYNWRRRDDVYPRYPHVISAFENTFNIINNFFNENNLGELLPRELELSYINHIPNGEGWQRFEDLQNIFIDFPWKQSTGRYLPTPSKMNWTTLFPLPAGNGNLTVNVKEATRTTDKVKIIVLELIARRICDKPIANAEMRAWYDLAHEWIVKGFTDLTNPEIQKNIWEREDA